jgi:hypothetical protein
MPFSTLLVCKLTFSHDIRLQITYTFSFQTVTLNRVKTKHRLREQHSNKETNKKPPPSPAQKPLVGQILLIVKASQSHSVRHTTLGRTSLDEGSAQRRDFYVITHNIHKSQTSMPPAAFETTILESERPQSHALDCAAA